MLPAEALRLFAHQFLVHRHGRMRLILPADGAGMPRIAECISIDLAARGKPRMKSFRRKHAISNADVRRQHRVERKADFFGRHARRAVKVRAQAVGVNARVRPA